MTKMDRNQLIRRLLEIPAKERGPIYEEVERMGKPWQVLNPKNLTKALAKLSPYINQDIDRVAHYRILFESKNGMLTLVAAEGLRGVTSATLEVNLPEGEWLMTYEEAQRLQESLKTAKKVKIGIEREKLVLSIFNGGEERILLSPGSFPGWREAAKRSG